MKGVTALWRELIAGGAFLIAVTAQFVEAPPGDDAATPLATFCVAVMVSIAYAAMRKWDDARFVWAWSAVALGCLIAVLLAHNHYSNDIAQLTARYSDEKRVVGTEFTSAGQVYAARNPHKVNADLLFDAGGDVSKVWTERSIQSAKHRLRYGYLACAPLVGAAVVASTQVAKLTRRRSRRRK